MKKFGTFSGVFVPSFEAILGAVLFLVLPALVNGMGITNMVIIVILANSATLATAFSISDCTTNLQTVGAGGMYALSKRSLGKAFGGSIGIQLFFAQSASIGFYAIGFADPLQSLLSKIPYFAEIISIYNIDAITQKQIIGTTVAFFAFIAASIGASFIVKIQMIIFVVLILSVSIILCSPFFGLEHNSTPVFLSRPNLLGTGMTLTFWAAFTAFFPAVTGIDAGVGMSGNLKDPKKSLPKGTFLSILVTLVVYVLITIVFGYVNPEFFVSEGNKTFTAFDVFKPFPFISYILLIGILFATGSSALSYFVTAPFTAQTLAKNKLLPGLFNFLKYDFKKGGEQPRWATVVTFFIVIPVIWVGDVTSASMVVGICFLIVYGWVNFAAFLERVSGNPSFRPTSKGHWLISLYGFLICMIVIGLFDPLVGVSVFISQTLIFYLLLKFKSHNRLEGVWWGLTFSIITYAMKKMGKIVQGTKNWRPIMSIFTFADREDENQELINIGTMISDYKGLVMTNVIVPPKYELDRFTVKINHNSQYLQLDTDNYDSIIYALTQSAFPGKMKINTVLLPIDDRINHASLIENLIAIRKNVLLFKKGLIVENPISRIDIWWKGEENGNFMALLAYIIVQSHSGNDNIRIIRKLWPGEDESKAKTELETLIVGARLKGEILILPHDEVTFHDSLRKISAESSLIFIGMPGKRSTGLTKIFSLDKKFFSRELKKYYDLPSILFVKASGIMRLIE